MAGKGNISQYRERLDRTISSPDLSNEDSLKALVKRQILSSNKPETKEHIDNVVERRTREVSNFLAMQRSASAINDHRCGWKVKQDTEEFRVMYKEGPEGTPFHTLLAEGYVDGPIDICLCISWEATLYAKWWPQTVVPTFKIITSECLQKVRIGEQISLVRMKIPWPLSAREVLTHFFVFEYFQDDLIVVLLNSIPEVESIDISSHGFTKDGIPEAQDVVRIDVVGGFALQKVTADRSYFRTIATMDLKMDFVPPALINFVSRQLIGSGFKLYKKEVASISGGDEDFQKVLKEPLYAWIRKALYSENTCLGIETKAITDMFTVPVEHLGETSESEGLGPSTNAPGHCDHDHETHSVMGEDVVLDQKDFGNIKDNAREIDKEVFDKEIKEGNGYFQRLVEVDKELNIPSTSSNDHVLENFVANNKNNVARSLKVKQALETLETVISILREHRLNPEAGTLLGTVCERLLNVTSNAAKCSRSSEDHHVCSNGGTNLELPHNKLQKHRVSSDDVSNIESVKKESTRKISLEPRNSNSSHGSRQEMSNSYSSDVNHNRVAPASMDRESLNICDNQQVTSCSMENLATELVVEKVVDEDKLVSSDADNAAQNSLAKKKKKFRSRFMYRLLCS